MFPPKLYIGQTMSFSVEHGLREPHKGMDAENRLGYFFLPPFQRMPVWSVKQQSQFVESLWLGLPVSVYAYNSDEDEGETDGWLIDGQQRWRAIYRFVANDLAVFDGMRYSDMDERQHRQFRNLSFPCILIRSKDAKFLEEIYLRLAYGGTPHEPLGVH